MLYKNINKTEPLTLFLLLFMMFVWSIVYMSFIDTSPWISDNFWLIILGGFIYVFTILLYQHTLRKYYLSENGYLTLFIILLLSFSFPEVLILDRIILAFVAHMFMLRHILNLNNNNTINLDLFDAGMFSGISFLLFPQSVLFFLLIYIGYLVFVKFIDQRIFIPIIGFVSPVFLWIVYQVLIDEPLEIFNRLGFNSINLSSLNFKDNFYLILGFFSILITISAIVFIKKTLMASNVDDQKYKLLFPGFFIGLVVVLSSLSQHKNSLIFIFLPTAVLLSFWMKTLKKYWLKEVVLWIIVLISFWQILIRF